MQATETTYMINRQLLQPESIVVVGGSNNIHKPGGAVVRNLLDGKYDGELHIINPKEDEVQGIKATHTIEALPDTELAILVVAARFCPDYVEQLAREKNTKAFIIISAGFSEETAEGEALANPTGKKLRARKSAKPVDVATEAPAAPAAEPVETEAE